jgi:hypothetical protein
MSHIVEDKYLLELRFLVCPALNLLLNPGALPECLLRLFLVFPEIALCNYLVEILQL